jgi:hypothetical protein
MRPLRRLAAAARLSGLAREIERTQKALDAAQRLRKVLPRRIAQLRSLQTELRRLAAGKD